jgi:hypothetical protein
MSDINSSIDDARGGLTSAANALDDAADFLDTAIGSFDIEDKDIRQIADDIRALLASLETLTRRFDSAFDVNPREKGDDDGVEYGDPREALWEKYNV